MAAGQTKRDRLEAKEAAIVEAAAQVFLERGLDGATMSEIARAAHVADGTLYLYFKNKTALMMAVVAAHWARITRGAEDSVKGVEGFFAQLEAHARYHMRMICADWRLIELRFALLYTHPAAESDDTRHKRAYAATFDRIYRRAVDRGEIRGDVSTAMARDMFYGALEYSGRTLVYHRPPTAFEEAIEQLLAVMRHGFTPPAPAPGDRASNDHEARLAALVARLERAAARLEADDGGGPIRA